MLISWRAAPGGITRAVLALALRAVATQHSKLSVLTILSNTYRCRGFSSLRVLSLRFIAKFASTHFKSYEQWRARRDYSRRPGARPSGCCYATFKIVCPDNFVEHLSMSGVLIPPCAFAEIYCEVCFNAF
jgi:hypothetical protein